MAATARKLEATAKDLSGDGGGAYASIEVPGDYEAVLVDVNDFDNRQKGGSWGWRFSYGVETPTGGQVVFDEYLGFSPKSRWKIVQIMEAHGVPLEEGINELDPNALIGEVVGVHIDFPRDEHGEPSDKYREITQVFSLVNPPEVEEAPDEGLSALDKAKAQVAEQQEYDPERDGPKFGEDDPEVL